MALRCLFPVVNFVHLPAASTALCYSKYCNSFENSVPAVFGNNFKNTHKKLVFKCFFLEPCELNNP